MGNQLSFYAGIALFLATIIGGCAITPAPGSSGEVDGGILSGGVNTKWESPPQPGPQSRVEANTELVRHLEHCKLNSQGTDACLCYVGLPIEYQARDSYWLENYPHTQPELPPSNVHPDQKTSAPSLTPSLDVDAADSTVVPPSSSVETATPSEPAPRTAIEMSDLGVEYDNDWCRGNLEHPYCKALRTLFDLKDGCKPVAHKDYGSNFFALNTVTYTCSPEADAILSGENG